MKVTLLHNPYAGDADQPSGAEILSLIRSAGHSAVYQSSKEPGWEKALEEAVGIESGPWGSTSFIEGLGVGLFVDTMSRLNAKSNFPIAHLDDTSEKIMSVMEIIRSRLEKYPANWLNVTLDGQDLSGEYVLLEAMNIRCVGPNLCLAPDADPC